MKFHNAFLRQTVASLRLRTVCLRRLKFFPIGISVLSQGGSRNLTGHDRPAKTEFSEQKQGKINSVMTN